MMILTLILTVLIWLAMVYLFAYLPWKRRMKRTTPEERHIWGP